ncbi:hypothetical protein D043_4349B, partial [Vibrio parahaemolyticus EKP-021]
KINKKDTKPF